jgi:hypothetical protein
MRITARFVPVWTYTPQWRGFIDIISPFEGIGMPGASGMGFNPYVIPPLLHKYGVFHKRGKRQEVEAAILEICPDIYAADINLFRLTECIRGEYGLKVDRATVRRALTDLRAANKSPR